MRIRLPVMSTVDKNAADRIIRNNGFWYGPKDPILEDLDKSEAVIPDPRCIKIVQYENAWGGVSFGLVFENDRDPFRYQRVTEYVRKPKVIWVYEPSSPSSI